MNGGKAWARGAAVKPIATAATIVAAPREYPEYSPPGYYAVFFKDPDGIKYEIVCNGFD